MTPVLEARGLTKRFPGVVANDSVNLTLHKGKILALLGENGAGKTTLMNMLYGLYHPTEGEILINGKPVQMDSPNDAIAAGIGMVHQHFMLVPVMTVTENIMLGVEETRGFLSRLPLLGRLDRKRVTEEIRALSKKYNLALNPDDTIKDLSVGIQQRAEIIKALYRKADILILDEPTAVLTPQEADELFEIMHNLTAQGVSIIFITHKLKEVLAVADDIAVLPVDIGWTDIGSWATLLEVLESDERGNVIRGRGLTATPDTRDTLIYTATDRLVATVGVENLVIIDTEDAVLVCPRERAEGVREIVDQLKETGHSDYLVDAIVQPMTDPEI